ncbi:MAG: hypothetical protein RIR11_3309 [Bacteroidota bacterium]
MKVTCYTFKGISIALVFILFMGSLAAQRLTGVVTDAGTNEVLVGATVAVKNANKGTSTDNNGQFMIDAREGEQLVISYIGYESQELTVGSATTLAIQLVQTNELKEVVITSLNISRDKKSLGYAIQEVSGSSLDKARETNIVSALAGKVAGVTIVGNPSGIGSSARITIRGERSLNLGRNQPLFVVDGVPISNEFRGSSGSSFQEADYGNGAGFVNPDDVASMTVLKGASAAALYGSRANNGVILITTKSGKGTKGIGVTINSTVSFENVLVLPEYQNVYGQGLGGEFSFKDGNGGGTADGVDESWGPKMDGQLIPQFDSPTSNGFRGGDVGNLFGTIGPVNLSAQLARRGEVSATPFSPLENNVRDFFETGVTQTHNVALAGSNEKSDFRLSYTWLDQTGTVPNTDLNRNTIAFSGGYKLTNKLKVRTAINYLNSASANRPNLSYGTENIMYLFNCWLGRSVNVEAMRDYWQEGREGLNQFGFNYNYHDNPYFNMFENTNSQNIDRVFGNVAVTYDFTKELSLLVRSGTDASNEFRARKRAYSTQRFQRGSYREERIGYNETNTDFLLGYKKVLSEKFDFNVGLGGNAMRQIGRATDVIAPELAVPGIYTLGNSRVALRNVATRPYFQKRINSLYATGQVGFNNFLYLDLSARNDWSSTLPSDSRSYLYYAANVSAVLTDAFKMNNSVLSFAKARLGIAQVGNDTDPYQLIALYNAQIPVQGQPSYSQASQLVNPTLKPEISTSIETGFDVRFFNNRIGLDVTYYNTLSRNQLLPLSLSIATGYNSRFINAGKIRNQGAEVTLNLVPVKTRDFTWEAAINWSANRSKVEELYVDPISGIAVTRYVMGSRYINVEARVGEQMGDMYGIGYQRVSADPASPFYDASGANVGKVVYNAAGKPIATATQIKLGNYNPDWLGGISNTFTYKGLVVSALFDVRSGGEVYSHTQTVGREGGQIIETLEGRADGYDLTKEGNGVIGDGVVKNTDGTFSPNTVELSAREWHSSYTLGRRLVEGVIYDASFVKLREARIGYTIPNRIWGKTSIRDLSISLVGRNLALWSKVPHIDPETSSTVGGEVIPGVESVALPSTRSIGINLNCRF